MTQKNVAEVILQQLAAWGVRNVYGFIGDDTFYLFDALARQNNINLYEVRHEETAALMASSHAKITGQIGVCISDGGPGFIHLLNGLADAFTDRVPVLVISGQVGLKALGTNAKQYLNQQNIMSEISGYSDMIADPLATLKVMDKAYRTALTKKTVAHITVPMDLFSMPCDLAPYPWAPYLTNHPTSAKAVVDDATQRINQAHNPVVLVGEGGRDCGDLVANLATKCGAGIITTLAGSGTVSRNHPLYIGGLGHAGSPASSKILSEADLCIIVGAKWWPAEYVPHNIPTIEIDINPANIGTSTPYAYGLVGNSRFILSSILAGLETKDNLGWQNHIRKEISLWLTQLQGEAKTPASPIHPAAVIKAMERTLADDAIICLDTGDNTVWFGRIFRPSNQRIILSGKWRTMGFGLPAALAAKLNQPRQQVVALTGDGGFAMTMADFITAVRYKLPMVILLLNNHSFAMEKNKMEASGLQPVGTALLNPDFAAFARSCGGEGITVTRKEELEPSIEKGLALNKPVIIDIHVSAVPVPGT